MKKTARSQPTAARKRKASYSAPALAKGLDILELLASEPAGVTKSEISRRLQRTVSEIFRMLVCLEERGYIGQRSGEQYALTLKLFRLVQEHPPTERLLSEALPLMHHLVAQAQQSCHLAILDGTDVVILAQVNAPTRVGFYVKVGSTVDLMEAASGHVILAYQEGPQRDRLLADWREITGKKLPLGLQKHLQRIRHQGFELRPSYEVRGIVNLSYPLFDPRGTAIGALTIPFIELHGTHPSLDTVTTLLRDAAAAVTTAIGGRIMPEATASDSAATPE